MVRLARELVEQYAEHASHRTAGPIEKACAKYVADNPAPLTKEQLDRLPPGTVITNAGAEALK